MKLSRPKLGDLTENTEITQRHVLDFFPIAPGNPSGLHRY